jgi:hypothetical protein
MIFLCGPTDEWSFLHKLTRLLLIGKDNYSAASKLEFKRISTRVHVEMFAIFEFPAHFFLVNKVAQTRLSSVRVNIVKTRAGTLK